MKRSRSVFIFALAFLMCGAMAAPAAHAQRGRTSMRAVRSSSPSRSISRGHSSGRSSSRSFSGSRSSSLGLGGLGNIFDSGRRSSSSRSGSRGLNSLGDLFNMGRGGYGDRYGDWYGGRDRNHYDYPEAMRDAAIADAIVGVVGIIANTAIAPRMYSQPAYPAPGYAPSYAVPQYRTERVLVQEGRREEYEAWVPDTYDARTGETIKGHTVIRQRYIPEVWEERQVRVGP